jgi:hypothetical protein
MVYVQSTALEQVGYDPDRRCLRAKFRDSGRTYVYSEVPQEVYDSLLFAESVGTFFNENIRDCYEFEEL